jgi:blue light- and temperature-responsive anti-repressor
MNSEPYQILYCSRNRLQGTTAEVATQLATILQSARRNNAQAGVTGALLFNTLLFAQVLEGPLNQVEEIFEKIQCDRRHSDLIVLRSGLVETRFFGEWSMAFARTTSEQAHPIMAATLHAALANPSAAGEQVLSLLRSLVLQEEDWALPNRRSTSNVTA